MIRTNIRGRKYSNIFEYPNIRHTMFQICPGGGGGGGGGGQRLQQEGGGG